MPLQYELSYDSEFVDIIRRLQACYPDALFELDGISPAQLDLHQASQSFFNSTTTAADVSVDGNANVSGRDVITYNYEVPKALMKLNSYYNLWKILKESAPHLAERAIHAQISGDIYINDVWDIGRPYCFNFSTYDIALEGLKMGNRLTVDPPKSLFTFLKQVEQFTVYAANSTLGATGLADLLIVASCYVQDIFDTGYDNHIKVENAKRYVQEQLASLIYTLNWEFRGNQSPFTNVSLYDSNFLQEMLPGYQLRGKAPEQHTVQLVQDWFLQVYNATLARTPITFPVLTACFSVDENKKIRDPQFVKDIAGHNAKFGAINIYCGATSTLSSCCRLRSDTKSLGYSNTFGAGATKIGSLGVVTLNLPRLAQRHKHCVEAFILAVKDYTYLASLINEAKRCFIKKRIERGSLPLYSLGIMSLSRQYSTCGLTGINEAVRILGRDILTKKGQTLISWILSEVNATNSFYAQKSGSPHNCEQVPGESSTVKLAQKDALLGYNTLNVPMYSNQFIPLTAKADLLDRIKLQGLFDSEFSGGAILHLNVGERIEDPAVIESLIHHCAESGVVYWAINYALNRCEKGHVSVGGKDAQRCPECGAGITDTYTRVVGFLTNTKNWNRTRREHDWPQRQFYGGESAYPVNGVQP